MGTHLTWCVMNEYLSRSDIAPVDRIARSAAVVPGVTALAQTVVEAQPTPADLAATVAQSTSGADLATGSEDQLASAAEYARIHARIANIIANLRAGSGGGTISAADGDAQVGALLPEPVIIIPLPPASRDMVERAERLARDMAAQAALTRSAQSHLKPGTVDQILATAA